VAIDKPDEGTHAPTGEQHWRESHYFMFYDEAQDLAGFTTMSFHPNEGLCDAGFLLFRRGRLAYLYPQRDVGFSGPWDHWTVGGLRYELTEPLRSWRITLQGDQRARAGFTFDGVSPVYDYRDNAQTLPACVATAHYEQAGRLRGTLTLGGRQFQVDAVGHRDHSWGVRDWAGPANWKWITALFDDGAGGLRFAFNAWEVLLSCPGCDAPPVEANPETFHPHPNPLHARERALPPSPQRGEGRGEGKSPGKSDERTLGGFVFDGAPNHGLAPATRLELDYASDGRTPRGVTLHLVTDDGLEYHVTGRPRALFPLAKYGTIINEQVGEFELAGMGAHGYGVIETLWQSRGPLESTRWLLRAGWHMLRARFA